MKLGCEYLIKAYSKQYGINYTIVRPSAVYGPTDCNGRVVELFVTNALQGKPIVLENAGLHKLDFTFVEDIARGFSLSTKKMASNKTFNITYGEGRSIGDLARVIGDYIPSTKTIIKKVDTYRPNRGTLDISLARKYLGYNPHFSLEKGIRCYIDFIQSVEK